MEKANSVYLTREFNCSINELFRWIVEPQLIAQWFGPKHLSVANVETDLCVGGQYRIELLKPDDQRFNIEGEYIEITEPYKLVFSLKYSGLANTPPDSLVNIDLEVIDSHISKLSLLQKFDSMPSDMKNRAKTWEGMLTKLYQLLLVKYVRNSL